MYTLMHLVALTGTILLLARLLPSVRVKSVGSAIAVAIVFSLLNFFLGWFLRVVLFIPAILTLGLLFLFVPFIINTVLLWLTDKILHSFEIETTGGLLVSAGVVTFVNAVFHMALHAHRTGLMQGGPTRWI